LAWTAASQPPGVPTPIWNGIYLFIKSPQYSMFICLFIHLFIFLAPDLLISVRLKCEIVNYVCNGFIFYLCIFTSIHW